MRQDVNQRKGGFSESLTVGSDARNIKDERDLSGHVKIRVFSPFTMFTQRPTYKKWEKKKSVYHNKRFKELHTPNCFFLSTWEMFLGRGLI